MELQMTSQRSYSGDAASDEVMFNGLTAAETDATASVRGLDTSFTHAYAEGRADEREELERICAEAYQVVGSLLSDLGKFDTPEAGKILDNLSQCRLVHDDVLPWPSYESASSPSPAREEAGEDARKARRYEWLRDRLAIEDVERLQANYLGTHDEAESMRCDEAVDSAIEQMNKESK
jgi:hypothetical protein